MGLLQKAISIKISGRKCVRERNPEAVLVLSISQSLPEIKAKGTEGGREREKRLFKPNWSVGLWKGFSQELFSIGLNKGNPLGVFFLLFLGFFSV